MLVKDATIVEKENLEKELKQKDEEIQRIGRLLEEANEIMNKHRVELEKLKKVTLEKEEEDDDVEKNPMKKSTEMVEKSPKVRNELVKVIKKSNITKSVKALKRSTKVKDRRAIRKKKNSNLIERSKPGVG
ncbi:hypothetical protein LR48_Vigan07g179000 [Vigna angularis]|uniref:Uncharacterized protein n=1 Tax=Phaseolus angularis TaxID=3914 RepID=A0A0L9UZG2_PHAAN|nr:hypothetical protein LR48_Vigan07g179000 [Vigna angularis]